MKEILFYACLLGAIISLFCVLMCILAGLISLNKTCAFLYEKIVALQKQAGVLEDCVEDGKVK